MQCHAERPRASRFLAAVLSVTGRREDSFSEAEAEPYVELARLQDRRRHRASAFALTVESA